MGRYTYGHSAVVVDVHGQRAAVSDAAFFLPHLRPGMRLLDAGCGPGSITVGLAQVVAPGETIGLDLETSVLARARALAGERGVTSLSFVAGEVGRLPFPDASFDAVFAHTLVEHLPDPRAAIRELRRALRPGGVLGLRDCDWASGVFAPPDRMVAEAMSLYARLWRHNGGQPNSGRRLRAWLNDREWSHVECSASFRWDGSAASSRSFGELLAARFQLPEFIEPIVARGWSDRASLARLSAACLDWSRRPDIIAVMVMCEAVARRR